MKKYYHHNPVVEATLFTQENATEIATWLRDLQYRPEIEFDRYDSDKVKSLSFSNDFGRIVVLFPNRSYVVLDARKMVLGMTRGEFEASYSLLKSS